MSLIRACVADWLSVGEVPVRHLAGNGAVLVLAPHPDDETLGCGAAIAAASDAGIEVRVAVVTDGRRSHPGSASYPALRLVALRAAEVAAAVSILTTGRTVPAMLQFRDQSAPESHDAATRLAACRGDLVGGIGAIWTTWSGDPHPDHQRTARLAAHLADMTGARLLQFPIWGRVQGDDAPGPETVVYRIATGPWRDRKRQAIAAHGSQTTAMIDDDPAGFILPEPLVRHFVESDELFFETPR